MTAAAVVGPDARGSLTLLGESSESHFLSFDGHYHYSHLHWARRPLSMESCPGTKLWESRAISQGNDQTGCVSLLMEGQG